jgi:hypothetical protein
MVNPTAPKTSMATANMTRSTVADQRGPKVSRVFLVHKENRALLALSAPKVRLVQPGQSVLRGCKVKKGILALKVNKVLPVSKARLVRQDRSAPRGYKVKKGIPAPRVPKENRALLVRLAWLALKVRLGQPAPKASKAKKGILAQ